MKKLFLVLFISNLILSCSLKEHNKQNNFIEISQFNDKSDTLTINEILKKPFKNNHSNTIGFNLKSKTLWCKLVIHITNPKEPYFLKLNDALIDKINVYDNYNGSWNQHQYGFLIPQNISNKKYPFTTIPIKISTKNKIIYYLKIKSRIAKDIPILLLSKRQLIENNNKNLLVFGLLYGILFAFVLYNIIIFLILKNWFYFNFSLAILTTTIVQSFLNGHASFFLFPNHPEIAFYSFFILICLGVFFVTSFSNIILEIQQNNHKIYFLLLQIIKGFSLICIPAILVFNFNVFSILVITLVSFYSIILFQIGIAKWIIKGDKIARIFTIGWIIYFLGIFSIFLRSQNLISTNWLSTNITFTSYLGEIIMFSIALAIYYNSKKKAEKRAQKLFTANLNDEVIRKTQELTKTIHQKNELLTEVHHRVKNNIQIIYSLFNMRERRVKSKEAISVLKSGKNKLMSMALVHEHLYLNNSYRHLDSKKYFTQLLSHLKRNSIIEIIFSTNIEKVKISNGQAIPFGLIATEIVTNSIKHAFKNGNNKIEFSLKKADNFLVLNISDNGTGFNIKTNSKKSLGITIIKGLVKQLDGFIEISSSKDGTYYSIKIPIQN
jgi:two-component sensor histidine kinase